MQDDTTAGTRRPPIDIASVDLGGAAVLITDRAGTIVDVNDAFVRITGYSRNEAVGASPRMLGSGLQPSEVYEELWDTVLSGEVWTGQLVDRHRDGRLRTHRVTITPVQGGDGRISHLVAVQRDLAAHRTQPIVASGIGELHTDQTGRCTFLDVEAARMLDAPMDALYARGWEGRLTDDDSAAVKDSIEAAATSGRHQRLDVRTVEARWLHLEIVPLTDQARGTIGTSWHLEDITGEMESHARLARRDAVVAALLEAIDDPVAVINADGTVMATNPAWSRGTADEHPLLGSAPGDDLPVATRQAASRGQPGAERLAKALHRQLQGLPVEHLPEGLELHPLANEYGGFVIRLSHDR